MCVGWVVWWVGGVDGWGRIVNVCSSAALPRNTDEMPPHSRYLSVRSLGVAWACISVSMH